MLLKDADPGDFPSARKIRVSYLSSGHKESNGPEGERGDHGRCGNGEHPGPDDALGHAPANGGKPCSRTHTDDRSSNGMRGADGNAVIGQHKERCSARALSAKP